MIIPPIITPLNLLLTRSAIDAGSTITADTRSEPAIGIITAITTPVIIVNRFVIKRTGNPAVIAVSSSNDNTYSGLRKITYNATTTTASRIIIIICCCVIVTIEPNKNWSTLNVERPFCIFIRIRAIAIPPDIRIATVISEYPLKYFPIASMKTAAIITTISVVSVGFIPKRNPNATPTRDTCDKVSAISDCLLRIKNNPRIGVIKAIAIPEMNALCMKP